MPTAGLRLFGHGIGAALAPITPPTTAWTLGPLWSNSTICARNGIFGLQRTGDGVNGTSIASTAPITVVAGGMLFATVYVKAGSGADGVIGFGFAFYNSTGGFLSQDFVETTGFSTSWVQLVKNFTVPAFAVMAIPIIRAVGHLTGLWCVDTAFVSRAAGSQRWKLSSLKHWYGPYVSGRG